MEERREDGVGALVFLARERAGRCAELGRVAGQVSGPLPRLGMGNEGVGQALCVAELRVPELRRLEP